MSHDPDLAVLREVANGILSAAQALGDEQRIRWAIARIHLLEAAEPGASDDLLQRAIESARRANSMPALPAIEIDSGSVVTDPVAPTATRICAIGMSAFLEAVQEDRVIEQAPIGPVWDGVKIHTEHARNDWDHHAVIIVESETGQAETFSVVEPENLVFTDISNPANTFGNGGVTDYDNQAARPIRLWFPEYMENRTAQSHFQGTKGVESHKWTPNQSPDGVNGLVATRAGVGKHKPAFHVDSAAPGAPTQHTVQGLHNFRIRLSAFAASSVPPGTYECPITLRDSQGDDLVIVWRKVVPAFTMPNADAKPFLAYLEDAMISDFVNGETYPSQADAAAKNANTQDWLDRHYRMARMFNLTPYSPDQDGTPVPNARHEPRILGGLYSGQAYLGRNENTELPVHLMGAYNQWRNWTGVGASDLSGATPQVLLDLLGDWETWRVATGFGGQPIVQLQDEVSRTAELVEQNHMAGHFPADWLKMLTAGSSNDDPNVETVWRFLPTAATTYPNLNFVITAANAYPKSLLSIVQDWKAALAGAVYAFYNGHAGCDYSAMLDDDLAGGQAISGFGTAKLAPAGLNDYYMRWHLAYTLALESGETKESLTQPGVYDRFGRWLDGVPADGVVLRLDPNDPANANNPLVKALPGVDQPFDGLPRFNPWVTAQTIGTNDTEYASRARIGDDGHLHSQSDGWYLRAGQSAYWPGYAPGVDRLDVHEAMFGFSMRQSIVQLAEVSRGIDNAATQAACDAVVPDGTYLWELGTKDDNFPDPSPDQQYGFTDKPRLLDLIDRNKIHTGISALIAIH